MNIKLDVVLTDPSVCLSVCLPNAGIVSNNNNVTMISRAPSLEEGGSGVLPRKILKF